MTPRSLVGIDVPGSRVNAIDPVLCDYYGFANTCYREVPDLFFPNPNDTFNLISLNKCLLLL
jgi:hypothetical protein